MKLEGIHHITAITGDAPRNVEFYAGLLGLRLVKKTVNQDDPTVYHLFYADEQGSPGADLTFFEYPGAARGTPGAGMVHRILWRVAGEEALDFWQARLAAHEVPSERTQDALRFSDPEGLEHELLLSSGEDEPLLANAPDIPAAFALQGFEGVRAYADDPSRSESLLRETLGFSGTEDGHFEVRGEHRGGLYIYDASPPEKPRQGAGSVHHVAFASVPGDHERWRQRVQAAGAHPTPVIDRFYFRSIYFREPSGVLFEIATIGPGFGADEDPQHLGERLSLPPRFEALRERLEATLTPLPNPRRRPEVRA
ncbi:MAG TPA: VOC family protein [Solirubrobacteraceae bacterium]